MKEILQTFKKRFIKLLHDITSVKILAVIVATWLVFNGKITDTIWLGTVVFALGGRVYEKRLNKLTEKLTGKIGQ